MMVAETFALTEQYLGPNIVHQHGMDIESGLREMKASMDGYVNSKSQLMIKEDPADSLINMVNWGPNRIYEQYPVHSKYR